MTLSVRNAYKRLLKSGRINADASQARAVEALARLERDLSHARDPLLPFLGKPKAVKGLYLWGPPGRGKSMLMDLFFDAAPTAKKERRHFHAFMAEVHDLVRQWRDGSAADRKRVFGARKGDDPIEPVADVIAARSRLLCFDELQVTDIADAMILGRLFEALFDRRVTLVATSNRPPEDLYSNGINRQLFEPFIDLIKQRCAVCAVEGPRDFRLDRLAGSNVYFTPADAAGREAFDRLWRDLTDVNREVGAGLDVLGRRLEFPRAVGGQLRASFERLCDEALGPQDYLAIAERFHTVFIEGVPVMGPQNRNAARRFVTLIDALYEDRDRVVILADAEPEALYPAGDGAFEFERTVSRLREMQSVEYLKQPHG
ncbi:MAG TPA: cell division protein ZapE [Caulobacteraceae bacterium]|nr:cell division protein ZapE [Caulobacteraceae bacterium]